VSTPPVLNAPWQVALNDLKRRIELDFGSGNAFFFKSVPEEGILGYWGNGPTVFIAEKPTRPPANRRHATRRFAGGFFDALKRHGFEDAHLTDLIKHFPGSELSRSERVKRNWPYLMEELSIVEAKIVVAVGSAVFNVLKRRIDQPLYLMPHYSYRFISPGELRRRLDDALDRVVEARATLTGTDARGWPRDDGAAGRGG
jgi:uracil DNA glycosylase superfamily protein